MKSLGFLETQLNVPRKDSEKDAKFLILKSTLVQKLFETGLLFPDRIVIRIGNYICWAAPRHVSSTHPSQNTDDGHSQSITSNAGVDI